MNLSCAQLLKMAQSEIILVPSRRFGGKIQVIFVGQISKFLDFVGFFSPLIIYHNIKNSSAEFISLKSYAVALLVFSFAAFTSFLFSGLVNTHAYLFLIAPVIISALYGGVGPALFSIVIGVLVSNLIDNNFIFNQTVFLLRLNDLTFILEGLIISWISILQKRRQQSFAINLLREQNARLRAQNTSQNLMRLEKQKDDFIAIAAHELKNPLASIKAFTQILIPKAKSKSIKQYLLKLNLQADRLDELVNQLFDVSIMTTGQLRLKKQPVNFDEVILSTIIDLQHTIATHKITVEGHSKAEISIDAARVKEVIINLVANAVKYSPNANEVIVRLTSTPDQILFSVKDFGEGVSSADQRRIFERFYRAGSYNVSGLGLGLFIASEIVKSHGGKIWLSSTTGKGSTFFFSLPKEKGN